MASSFSARSPGPALVVPSEGAFDASDGLTPEARRALADPAFAELRRKRNRLALVLTVVMMLTYYGFILMVAFAPKTLATPVAGVVSLGIVLGLAVIVVAIVLTGIYVNRANAEFDRLTRAVGGFV